MVSKIKNITFLGHADAKETDDVFKSAFEIARICAQKGYIIINGGGPGVMKASTLGAKSVGGKAIGVTFYPKDIPNFEGRDETNKVDQLIVVKNYLARTLKLFELGHLFIIFNGGTGTISEFGMAWGLAKLYFGHHKPVILYGDFWNEIILAFTKTMYITSVEKQVFKIAQSPEEVLSAIEGFEKQLSTNQHKHGKPILSI